MSVYGLLKLRVEGVRDTIREQTQSRQRSSASSELETYIWRGDAHLAEAIGNLKSLSMTMGSDFTKLMLIANKGPSENEIGALISEAICHIDSFGTYFTDTFLGTCCISPQLFALISAPVINLFNSMIDCIVNIMSENWDTARASVGKVIDITEKTINKQLPSTNKVAYRRAMMEKVNATAAIIDEFTGYCNKSTNQSQNNTDDEDIDDDDEGTYTPEELDVMESHLDLLKASKDVLKVALDVVTEASDFLQPLSQNGSASAAGGGGVSEGIHTQANAPSVNVFDNVVNNTALDSSGSNTANTTNNNQSTLQACRHWVSEVMNQINILDKYIVEYGCDLYSPLEDEQTTSHKYNAVKETVQEIIHLLKYGVPSTSHNTDSVTTTFEGFRHMYSESSNDALDTVSLNMIALIITRTHLA